MDDAREDPRVDELGSLEAIYPEIQRPHADDPFTFTLEVPVRPINPVTVKFPAASTATYQGVPPGASTRQGEPGPAAEVALAGDGQQVDSHQLSYLPPVSVTLSLPHGYPSKQPPKVQLATSPAWVPPAVIKSLERDADMLWENMGRDLVAFTYIDHIQQAAESVFGMADPAGNLEIGLDHMAAILDYDIKARREAFELLTFSCEVCLDLKKGHACHQMINCGHVFCLACLRDFYADAINHGDVSVVRCLAPGCAKKREEALASMSKTKQWRPRVNINPSELLTIGLDRDVVLRYVSLLYKKELAADKNTIYCPRRYCNGAARSKRHKKPKGLEFQQPDDGGVDDEEDEDDEGEDDAEPEPGENNDSDQTSTARKRAKPKARLAICDDCGYSFCVRCKQTWHGDLARCRKELEAELREADRATLNYLERWTSECPTCQTRTQKVAGCNHMICFRCKTHFCYLCTSWLDPMNPYAHWNSSNSSCNQQLFQYAEGHGENLDFRDRRAPHVLQAVPVIEEPGDESDTEDELDTEDEAGGRRPRGVQVEREGPLVLRIEAEPRRRRNPAAPVPPPAPVPPAPRAGGAGRANGGQPPGRQPARGGRGGGARGARGAARGRGGLRGGATPNGRPNHNPNPNRNRNPIQRGGANPRQAQREVDNALWPENEQEHHPFEVEEHVEGDGLELNAEQEAWVRRFVELALVDEEDSGSELEFEG